MNLDKICFIDTETTGLEDPKLCQLAYCIGDGDIKVKIFNPEKEIEVGAMAVHHITNEMAKEQEKFIDSEMFKEIQGFIKQGYIFVAHNAKFDLKVLENDGLVIDDYICTLKIGKYLDKDEIIPSHKLQYLRYYLKIDINATAHDAEGDVLVLRELFKRLNEKINIDEMKIITKNALILKKFPFGKYKGQEINKVNDTSYINWMLKLDNLDEDLRHTLEKI